MYLVRSSLEFVNVKELLKKRTSVSKRPMLPSGSMVYVAAGLISNLPVRTIETMEYQK